MYHILKVEFQWRQSVYYMKDILWCGKVAVELDATFEKWNFTDEYEVPKKQLKIGTSLNQTSQSQHDKSSVQPTIQLDSTYTIISFTIMCILYQPCFDDTFSNSMHHFQVEMNRLEIDSTL